MLWTCEILMVSASYDMSLTQVWFQNRRARFRKQERTGCVSSRHRQRRNRILKDSTPLPPSSSFPPVFHTLRPPNLFPPTSSFLPAFHTLRPPLPPLSQSKDSTLPSSSSSDFHTFYPPAYLPHTTPSTFPTFYPPFPPLCQSMYVRK